MTRLAGLEAGRTAILDKKGTLSGGTWWLDTLPRPSLGKPGLSCRPDSALMAIG